MHNDIFSKPKASTLVFSKKQSSSDRSAKDRLWTNLPFVVYPFWCTNPSLLVLHTERNLYKTQIPVVAAGTFAETPVGTSTLCLPVTLTAGCSKTPLAGCSQISTGMNCFVTETEGIWVVLCLWVVGLSCLLNETVRLFAYWLHKQLHYVVNSNIAAQKRCRQLWSEAALLAHNFSWSCLHMFLMHILGCVFLPKCSLGLKLG